MSNGEDEIFSDTNITEEIHWYEGHPESLILRRVRVQWADADYEGTILSFDEESENHLVLYDDEEKKTYNVYRRLGVELLSADSVLPASSVVAKNGGAVAYLEQLKNSSRRKSSPNSAWPAKKFPRHNTSSDDDEMEYTRNQAFDRSNGYGDSL